MYITFSIFYKLDIRKQYKSNKYQRTITYVVRMYRSGLNKSNKIIIQYCTVLHRTVHYYSVSYCIVSYTVLYCTVLV